ncbi:MAG: DUF3800 domain-containing protein [bacterium]|nr:DUF3800 domain-containing protein [bacterium]
MPVKTSHHRYYYVDEAGDPYIFNRRGEVIFGKEGCSNYFILGLLEIRDQGKIERQLNELRANLLQDSYFSSVPSMQPQARKTYYVFHAKDDLPEIRREVFRLLFEDLTNFRFYAVIKNKTSVLNYIRNRNATDPQYRYTPNELYDFLVRRLFKERLHQADSYSILVSKRSKKDRTTAFVNAVRAAQQRFLEQHGIIGSEAIQITSTDSTHCGGLQSTDYFLWALQRFYEKGEERFIRYLWDAVRLVQDIDDTSNKPYGEYYTKRQPLNWI